VRPVLFSVGGRKVYSYPALLYAGLVSGFYVMYGIAPTLGLARLPAALALLILFVPALVGSRLWFVVDHWSNYRQDRRRIWRRSEGGMALYGGLILALLISPAILSAVGAGFVAFWDAATFAILVAMVFTRVGCLLNGCCSGRACESPIGIWLPDPAGHWQRRHPVQILEMAAALVLLLGAVSLLAVGVPRGAIFIFGLVGYGSVRLALDRLRDRPELTLTTHPVAVTIFVVCSLALFAAGWLAGGG
jgi:phosphatidylglycerol---prolipoprotein diacylglyceryl transferase